MNDLNLLLLIVGIGTCTYLIRVIFIFYSPKIIRDHYVSTGLNSVPSSMLIALVIPFLLFTNNGFEPLRMDVLAIVVTIPIIHKLKKYQYGLVFALIVFVLISIIQGSLNG